MVKDKIAEAIKFFENCLKEKGLTDNFPGFSEQRYF